MIRGQKVNETMMLSELIRVLQIELDEEGDAPVFIQDNSKDNWGDIFDVGQLVSSMVGLTRCALIWPSVSQTEYRFE